MSAHYRVDVLRWNGEDEVWEAVVYETSQHQAKANALDRVIIYSGVRVVAVDATGGETILWEEATR